MKQYNVLISQNIDYLYPNNNLRIQALTSLEFFQYYAKLNIAPYARHILCFVYFVRYSYPNYDMNFCQNINDN